MPSWINDARAAILKKHKDNYNGSTANEVRKLVKDIVRELRGTDGEPFPAKISKAIRDYYREPHDPPKYTDKWNLRKVVKHKKQAEINSKISAPTGSNDYLRSYNLAVTEVLNELSEEERKEYLALVEEWNKVKPPQEVQQSRAKKGFYSATRKYMNEIEREMGVKVCIFAAMLENEIVKAVTVETDAEKGFENDNKHAHAKALDAFALWAADAFDNEKDHEKDNQPALEDVKRRKGTKKDLWKLEVDKEGNPILPTLDECPKREDLKILIRSMATKAYRKHSKNPHSSVPWGLLQKNPEEWIEPQYWPRSISLQDPSHMKLKPAIELYDFWKKRQDNDKVPIKFQKATSDETISSDKHKRKRGVEYNLDEHQASTSKLKLRRVDNGDTDYIIKMDVDEMDIPSLKTSIMKEKGKGKGKEKEGGNKTVQKEKVRAVSVVVPCSEQTKKYNM